MADILFVSNFLLCNQRVGEMSVSVFHDLMQLPGQLASYIETDDVWPLSQVNHRAKWFDSYVMYLKCSIGKLISFDSIRSNTLSE